MSFKGFVKKFTACLLALMIVLFNTSVGAAEKTARLRSCLETVHMYQVFPIDFITSMAAESPSRFKDNYDDRYMAFDSIRLFMPSRPSAMLLPMPFISSAKERKTTS